MKPQSSIANSIFMSSVCILHGLFCLPKVNLPLDRNFLSRINALSQYHRAVGTITQLMGRNVPVHLAIFWTLLEQIGHFENNRRDAAVNEFR